MIVVYRLRSMPAQRSTRRPWSSCVTRTRRRRTRAASTPAAPWSRSPRTACRRRTPWRRRRATAARPPRPDRVLRRGPATTVAEEVGHGAAVGRRRTSLPFCACRSHRRGRGARWRAPWRAAPPRAPLQRRRPGLLPHVVHRVQELHGAMWPRGIAEQRGGGGGDGGSWQVVGIS